MRQTVLNLPRSIVIRRIRSITNSFRFIAPVLFWIVFVLANSSVAFGQRQPRTESDHPGSSKSVSVTLNRKSDGYRGIWYMNQPVDSEYKYKYSGGLGTYCAKHRPFAIYAPSANKTFFCYGGAKSDDDRALLHMVGEFDHTTKTVSRPTILLDKKTDDAHDNPVISIDDKGHIWIFSTSHGRARPSYIHRSIRPYNIDEFVLVNATRLKNESTKVPIDNFSYMQVWHRPKQGFSAFFTRYGYPAKRTLCFMSSKDGTEWSDWQRLAAVEEGHYQISCVDQMKIGTMFNYHPRGKGLNSRTNLYYLESEDNGKTWQTVDGQPVEVPLTNSENLAIVHPFEKPADDSVSKLVYLKDLQFDAAGRPVLLFLTSLGYEPGPQNSPRTWTIAKWNGKSWTQHQITTSDNNYDSGELVLNSPTDWRLIAPTSSGPQPFNPGGEISMWKSTDAGQSWLMVKDLTAESQKNHTYVRTIHDAHPDFIAIWADGDARKPSRSSLYFCNSAGDVFRLPTSMKKPMPPIQIPPVLN